MMKIGEVVDKSHLSGNFTNVDSPEHVREEVDSPWAPTGIYQCKYVRRAPDPLCKLGFAPPCLFPPPGNQVRV